MGFVTSGEGVLTKKSESFGLSVGSAFFINRDTSFTISGEDDLSYFYIAFYGRRAEELVGRIGKSESGVLTFPKTAGKFRRSP